MSDKVLDPTYLPDLGVGTSPIVFAFAYLLKTQNADARLPRRRRATGTRITSLSRDHMPASCSIIICKL